MGWVEVPVPEELEAAVKSYLMQLSFQAALVQWDMESMGEHLRSLEEEPRQLLSAVAAGVVSGDLVEDAEIAEQLGVNVREVYGVAREANGGNKGDLVYARAEPVPDGSGGTRNRQVLYMLHGYAVLVQQNEALGLDRPSA
jgi:hypothetical protein